jgi:hypothetical protein
VLFYTLFDVVNRRVRQPDYLYLQDQSRIWTSWWNKNCYNATRVVEWLCTVSGFDGRGFSSS